MNLAVCYERQGRTASAWTTYIEAGNLAKANGKPDRARAAEGKAAALSPKLARLTIRVASGKVASLEVQRDSIVVRSPMWGTAIPLDPGAHRIVATAPGRKGWQTGVDPLFRTG
jgi:serine/threonine-protein kinase